MRIQALVIVSCVLAWPCWRAEARTLHWAALDVAANLDADGRLHVSERQSMVFDGDWNGGERRFRVGLAQSLKLLGVRRIDSATGAAIPLSRGDLDLVDHYDFTDATTLRWRSRRPSDPPFRSTTLVYEIDYVLSNVLTRTGPIYLLDHDFAFPDRDGVIETFSLNLKVDPAWSAAGDTTFPVSLTRTNLKPGQSVVLTLPLHREVAAPPAAVHAPTSAVWLLLPIVTLLGFAGWRVRRYVRHEQANGRFEPLKPAQEIDPAWLAEYVLSSPPELVGARWDHKTGAPEVAAVLARLVQEGKLSSHVETRDRRVGRSRSVLHLAIPTPRPEYNTYEAALIKALFIDGDTTDTERVRKYYQARKRSFNPASALRSLQREPVDRRNTAFRRGGWKLNALLAAVAAASCGAAIVVDGGLAMAAFALLSIGLLLAAVVLGVGLGVIGFSLRENVVNPRRHLQWLLAAYAGYVVVLLIIVRALNAYLGWPMYIALAALAACALNIALNNALTRTTPKRIAERKRLASARRYFAWQLTRPQPELKDEWYPYLVAFGLDRAMTKWFHAFGSEASSARPLGHASRIGSGTSGLGGGSQPGWSGGGGTFGGGGASGAWSTAAAAMGAGVQVASSSGHGGGGGGSSGGGGGGGW